MDLSEFRASTAAAEPPAGMSLPLQTLWWEAKGDWQRAHACAQEDHTPNGAIVHAYLHRVEGDLANANYWYRQAGQSPAAGALDKEWSTIVSVLLRR